MSGRLQDRVALVVGAARGIGRGIAERFAREGARLVIADTEAEAGQATADALGAAFRQTDISEMPEAEAAVALALERYGRLDILVQNAGIYPWQLLEKTSPEDWDRVMAVNLRSFFVTSHFAWPHLKAAGRGAIVHVSSVQGFANQVNVLGYATTKGAVHAMTRAMAVDCAPHGVRVLSVSPGSVRTPLLEYGAAQIAGPGGDPEEVIRGFGRGHPVGRIGTAEEVASMIAWCLSDEAAFVTGADLRIDGGLTARIGV